MAPQSLGLIGKKEHGLLVPLMAIWHDPYNDHSPQIVDAVFNDDGEAGEVRWASFSPSGTWLATFEVERRAGQANGQLKALIWDVDTAGIALRLQPAQLSSETKSVLCAFWQDDLLVCVVDTGRIIAWNATYSPVKGKIVRNLDGNLANDALIGVFPLHSSPRSWVACYASARVQLIGEDEGQEVAIVRSKSTENASALITACLLDASQACIWLASSTGSLLCYDPISRKDLYLMEDAFSAKSTILRLILHPTQSNLLLALLKDRTIRLIEVERRKGDQGNEQGNLEKSHTTTMEEIQVEEGQSSMAEAKAISATLKLKLLDAVNRWSWSECGFSHDGELIWASAIVKAQHLLYLWDAKTGALVKMLEGPRGEDLLAAWWNPCRPMLMALTSFGSMLRWVPDYPVKWTALVPKLEEIEENVEYVEREDEFDITVEAELEQRKRDKEMEELTNVDVLAMEDLSTVELADLCRFALPQQTKTAWCREKKILQKGKESTNHFDSNGKSN